jgi:U3 small nucleolar RNA-associated protein 12
LSEVLEAYGQFVKEEKNMLGFNMAALGLMAREIKEAQVHGMDDEPEEQEEKLERGTKKRAFASIA